MNLNALQIAAIIRDRDLRLQTLYKIVDKKKQSVRLIPNEIQKQIRANSVKRKLILKARQFGVTTDAVICLLDDTLFKRNQNNCILAHEQDSIKKIFTIGRYAHSQLPPPFDFELDRGGGSKYEMRFPQRNSKIYCDLESRSDTISKLHVSEFAFVKDPDKIMATFQAVPIDGHITLESTPNGFNFFHDMWIDDNDWEKLFFPWFLHHEYVIPTEPLDRTKEEVDFAYYALRKFNVFVSDEQIAFRRFKQRELKHLFKQEYPESDSECFLASGNAAMDLVKLSDILHSLEDVEAVDGLKVFKTFSAKGRYVCGCDTAEGFGGDYSVAVMIDCATREQVATLRGRWKPSDFAYRVEKLCDLYSKDASQTPLLAVERNNHGHAVIQELSEHIHYPNLYYHTDEKLGWLTDRVTRPVSINSFIDCVENITIAFKDPDLIKECMTLVNKDGKIEAEDNKHDDLVMAAAIAVQMYVKVGSVDLWENIGSLIRV